MAEVDIAPRFGAELKDGFKPVNTWVTNGIAWLEDVQQFYRERSAIEKEYSTKLSALAKKYFEKKTKRSSGLSVGDTPTTTPGSLESASMTTWAVQLTTLEQRAAEHDRFATDLISHLAEPVKHLSARCEDLRKQHADYALKLEKERDSTYADLRKSKGRYDATCSEVESRRKKVDSGFDHGKQKAQLAFQQQQSDMHNAKNTYLIDINVTNKQKEKYYHEYVPDLLDSLQDLSESRVSKLNTIWSRAAQIEGETLHRSSEYVKHLGSEVPRNSPLLDSMMFVRHNSGPWQEPASFVFEPSPVWLDDGTMASTENAKVFLRNVLGKRKGQLGELKSATDTKRRQLDGMKRTKQNVRDGKVQQDEIELARQMFQSLDELHEIERRKISAETEVLTIVSAVGDVSRGAKNHNFKGQTFKIPTNCDLCGERIWGLSAKGFDCMDCGFTCHSKCEMKVPADCPGEQDKEAKRRLKVERQDAALTHVLEEPIPDRQATASPLVRSDTMNSMNTLSSGYAASAPRSVPDTVISPVDGEEDGPPKPAPRKVSTNKPRVLAPPPTAYIPAPSNADSGDSSERRGKMLYAYEANGADEVSVDESKDVVILEPDDGSGWMKVRAGTKEGLVPASYVEAQRPLSAAHSDNERPASTYSASSTSLAGSIAGSIQGKKKGPAVAPKRGAKKLHYVEAMYDYTARSDQEHSIVEGDRLVLIKKDAGEGWSDVEKNGAVKSVPANYVQDI